MDEPTRFRRRYAWRTFVRSVTVWEPAEALVALGLAVVTFVGYLGLALDWWDKHDFVAWAGFAASGGLVAFFFYLVLFETPARMWHDAQPRPFGISFTLCSLQFTGHNHAIRVEVVNQGPTGPFRAWLVETNGHRKATSRVPLAWANEDPAEIPLLSDVPQQISLGYWYPRGADNFFIKPRAPGFPQLYEHDEISPPDKNERLHVLIEVRNMITNQAASQWFSMGIGRHHEGGIDCEKIGAPVQQSEDSVSQDTSS